MPKKCMPETLNKLHKAGKLPKGSNLLTVKNLKVGFMQEGEPFWAVRKISFTAKAGEVVGIVGESGSGKSMTALAVTGLLPPEAYAAGSMCFAEKTLNFDQSRDWYGLRGRNIGIVFQDPAACLNPLKTVGKQVAEPLLFHKKITFKAAEKEIIRLFSLLGVHPASLRFKQYPHQLSGGLQQRVMLAAAIACRPELLIADEPTTALDVTVQAQILKLLRNYVQEEQSALILISHDLGVIAQLADQVLVMCGGTIVEKGSVYDIMQSPLHPYTQLLLASLPRLDKPLCLPTCDDEIQAVRSGCVFAQRCPLCQPVCFEVEPESRVSETGREAACHFTGQ